MKAICCKCKHVRGILPRFISRWFGWFVADAPDCAAKRGEEMDYVHGYVRPVLTLCRFENSDGECPNFEPKEAKE